MNSGDALAHLNRQLCAQLSVIYPDESAEALAAELKELMGLLESCAMPERHKNLWGEKDCWVISYGDSLIKEGERPLHTLHNFLLSECAGVISGVHILPFYPWSSDDGFSVINYVEVNPALGDWQDISAIAQDFDLMADLVLNHCSSRSQWFENYKQRRHPGRDYFVEAQPDWDLSAVVRPRTSELLSAVQTYDGLRHVWCTFSHDQVDLNFRNPAVLKEFVRIIRHYLDQGVRIFRLDAVAFLWKEVGGSCLNLAQTHEIVRLLRTLVEHAAPGAILITETNIPLRENLAYFGNANEAHLVYNFSLPPLLLHALVNGDSSALGRWLMGMPAPQDGTAYLNFIASHDGIGLRPAEGLLNETDIDGLVALMQESGALVSWRALGSGKRRPYEINVSLFDAMRCRKGAGEDGYQEARFLCAHALMLALQGIPAFYIHSLLATPNDVNRVAHSNNNRAINRHQYSADALAQALTEGGVQCRIFNTLKAMIRCRAKQVAFHPNAAQYPLHLGAALFGLRRESRAEEGGGQVVLAIYNLSAETQCIAVAELNLEAGLVWRDILGKVGVISAEGEIRLAPYAYCWLAAHSS